LNVQPHCRILRAGAILVALAGCAADPAPVAPPLTLPAAFSRSGERLLPDRWWREFGDPRLDRLVATALDGSFTLRAAWNRLSQSRAIARREGASRFPTLDLDAGASGSDLRSDNGSTSRSGNGSRQTSDLSLGVAASYEVDLWGRLRSAREAAAFDAVASEQALQAAAATLVAQVARAWYQLLEQRGQVALLAEQVATNEQVLELVTLRFRQGQAAAADVLRQRQLVERTRGDAIEARARAAVLEHQLDALAGRAPGMTDTAGEGLIDLPPLPATGLPAELIERRPDVGERYSAIRAADRRVEAARADRYPRISLSASASLSAGDLRGLLDNWIATLAANLMAPLFDAGQRSAEVERSRAVLAERISDYGQTVVIALQEVEDALVQEARQRELIASLESQLTLSGQVLERLRDRYLNGAADYLDVLDALSTRQSLERDLLAARRALIELRVDLARALGGGWRLDAPSRIASVPGVAA